MKNGKFSIGRFMRKNVILLLLIAMIIVFSIAQPKFFTVTNLMNIYKAIPHRKVGAILPEVI